ncbi:unnamed protein product [Caenorhabditis bovis]|uniref:CB1 cannabinoid receptor-interacting protein 1 n=1 Tax=Caenorhabditis bovis TaxID=2654633 RepID=A0A8S1ETH7_9PELO|nr:unnamed protein product [Caenorhabditis bovis]
MSKYAFTVELTITEYGSDDPLAFKMDGHRFDGALRTLKWSADQTYTVKIVTRPATEVIYVNISGTDISMKKEKLGEYSGQWNTGNAEISKRGTRKPLVIIIKFEPEGSLRYEFQSKVYPKNDSHAVWGHKMNGIEWKCSAGDDGIVHILDENFR